MYNISKKYRSVFLFIAKLVIIIAAFYIITARIIQNGKLYTTFNLHFLNQSFSGILITMLIIFLFTAANWYFEIIKWKNLVFPVKKISLFDAFKQSTSSLTASLITPNRIGEYGAKAVYYSKQEQKKIMALNLLGNSSQMLITVLFGIPGLIYLSNYIGFGFQSGRSLLFFAALIIIFLILKQQNFFKRFIHFLYQIPLKIHFTNLLFSLIRYLIFSHQFYFLLMIFGVELNYITAMSLIFSTYIISSVIPGFVLFDFIIKGSVAVSLFGIFGVNEVLILMITTLMWILNFALPAIVGSYFVLTFNFPVSEKIPVPTK